MMADEGKRVSISKLCKWFELPRASFYYEPRRSVKVIDESLTKQIWRIIQEFPSYGLRRIHAVLKNREGLHVNRKKVHRIIKVNGWQKNSKSKGLRPRVRGKRHLTTRPNQLWAIDTTSIFCCQDGWCYLTAVIDCFDREIVGWRLSSRGKASVAAAALEDGLRARKCLSGENLTLRSDNGLVFGAKDFVQLTRRCGVDQEYITPYSPEQNGMIERFFRSLKEECVWLHKFRSKNVAFAAIADWMDFYNQDRVHSALGYVAPRQYREQLQLVA